MCLFTKGGGGEDDITAAKGGRGLADCLSSQVVTSELRRPTSCFEGTNRAPRTVFRVSFSLVLELQEKEKGS